MGMFFLIAGASKPSQLFKVSKARNNI